MEEINMRIDAFNPRTNERVRYMTTHLLGRGGGADVYRADALRLGVEGEAGDEGRGRPANTRPVAIKVSSALKWKGRLHREAEILTRVRDHHQRVGGGYATHVVRIGADGAVLRDVSQGHMPEAHQPVLIELEYLEGQTLGAWLDGWCEGAGEGWDALEAIAQFERYVRDLAQALEELRVTDEAGAEQRVLHRDIKPDNVMVTSRGLVVFDFNAAGWAEQALTRVGSPGYTAPEVFHGGEGEGYDGSVDLYSLGVIGWEILLRRRLRTGGAYGEGVYEGLPTWPLAAYAEVEEPVRGLVGEILGGTAARAEARFRSAGVLLEHLERLRKALAQARRQRAREGALFGSATLEALEQDGRALGERLDLIGLLLELRPSGLMSVVSDVASQGVVQDTIRRRTAVSDPLEDHLMARIEAALRGEAGAPRLIVLSGNAGDGKSHLLRRLLRERLAERAERGRVASIADATHADRPDQTQYQRLANFLTPFHEGREEREGDGEAAAIHLIAMNTGMVIQFFEEAEARGEVGYRWLWEAIARQLGLRAGEAGAREGEVEVINLDLRDLLVEVGGKSFAERMLDRLSPYEEGGLVAPLAPGCERCPARALCPVRFNLEALTRAQPRRALLEVLRRAALDPEIHLSPRALWGFFYRLMTGGQERYADAPGQATEEGGGAGGPCDVVRARAARGAAEDGAWLFEGRFYQGLFTQGEQGGVWRALEAVDPAFAPVWRFEQLQTSLSVNPQLDLTLVEGLEADSVGRGGEAGGAGGEGRGGEGTTRFGGSLAGSQVDKLLSMLGDDYAPEARRDAAVRRHLFFNRESLEAYRADGGYERFTALLDAYHAYSLDASGLSEAQQGALIGLSELVRDAFVRAHGHTRGSERYFKASKPNVRSTSELLVAVGAGSLRELFNVRQLVRADPHARVHEGRRALLRCLGYRPHLLTLSVNGHRLMVDLSFHDFLLQVEAGQQPSGRDLAQFQSLLYIGERLGNALVHEAAQQHQTLHVLDESRRLYALSRNAFGAITVEEVGR